MLEDLYENNSYEVLKRTAEVDGEKARERKCQKPAVQRTTEEEGDVFDNCIYVLVKISVLSIYHFSLYELTFPEMCGVGLTGL